MSDDLKAAAERRCAGGSVGFTAASWMPGSVERLLADATLLADAYLAEHPEPNPAHEAAAAKFRGEQRAGDGAPDGTRESLERCATMLDTYGPDLYPANEKGQIHFARAMMESVADEIRAFLAATATAG